MEPGSKLKQLLYGPSAAVPLRSALARLQHQRATQSAVPGASVQPMGNVLDAACIDLCLDSRSVSAENPTGARGAGGTACG